MFTEKTSKLLHTSTVKKEARHRFFKMSYPFSSILTFCINKIYYNQINIQRGPIDCLPVLVYSVIDILIKKL